MMIREARWSHMEGQRTLSMDKRYPAMDTEHMLIITMKVKDDDVSNCLF